MTQLPSAMSTIVHTAFVIVPAALIVVVVAMLKCNAQLGYLLSIIATLCPYNPSQMNFFLTTTGVVQKGKMGFGQP
ncbi:hypothetical protein Moror_1342 [Moniliophthora roreri MCA 2997]|uniref:Uncharacterized protein n=1 Tax=Moniliophthora roreri (strain MCA 2997) TaxID=1381753 RepID=V2WQU9_MONRO|nr:hypothetical protein Moror_1342 [Moniliophthora roreri MCA 2997]